MLIYVLLNIALVIAVGVILPVLANAPDESSPKNIEELTKKLDVTLEKLNSILDNKFTSTHAQVMKIKEAVDGLITKIGDLSGGSAAIDTQIEKFNTLKIDVDKLTQSADAATKALGKLNTIPPMDVDPDNEHIKYFEKLLKFTETIEKVTHKDRGPPLIAQIVGTGVAAKLALEGGKEVAKVLGGLGGVFKTVLKGGKGSAAALKTLTSSLTTLLPTMQKVLGFDVTSAVLNQMGVALKWPVLADNAAALMRRNLGLTHEYEERMHRLGAAPAQRYLKELFTETGHVMERYGFTLEDTTELFTTMGTVNRSFTRETKDMQEQILRAGVGMKVLGASTEASAHAINEASRSFGLGTAGALDFMEAIHLTTHEINYPFSQAMTDLQTHGKNLAHFGEQGQGAFRDLLVAVKNTDIGMDELVNTAQKFGEFDKAATLAGDINAILGGGEVIDEIALIKAVNEGDIVGFYRQIQNAAMASGQDLDDPYLIQAFAQQLGMSRGAIRRLFESDLTENVEAALGDGINMERVLGYGQGQFADQYAGIGDIVKRGAQQFNQAGNDLVSAVRPAATDFATMSRDTGVEAIDIINAKLGGAPAAIAHKYTRASVQQITQALQAAMSAMEPEINDGVVTRRSTNVAAHFEKKTGGGRRSKITQPLPAGLDDAGRGTIQLVIRDAQYGTVMTGLVTRALVKVLSGEIPIQAHDQAPVL